MSASSSKKINTTNEKLKSNYRMSQIATQLDKKIKINDEYPSYYGGMYISDESNKLILQVVKENIPEKDTKDYQKYNQILNFDNSIEVIYVKNSFSQLQGIYEKINEYYKKFNYIVRNSNFSNYAGHYIDIENNVIVLNLLDDSNIEREIANFEEKIVKSSVIKFSNGSVGIDEKNLKAGAEISVPDGKCSMGYRVKINGKNGYITAGHCFNAANVNIETGTVKKRQYSGSVDAAFVQTNSSYIPINELEYPDSSNTIKSLNNTMCPTLSVGQTIAHNGISTHYRTGKIKSLNYSNSFNGVLFTNLILANYDSDHGDSGGPVFIPSTTYGGVLVGIHKGSTSDGKVIVDANKIYNAFNYTRY